MTRNHLQRVLCAAIPESSTGSCCFQSSDDDLKSPESRGVYICPLEKSCHLQETFDFFFFSLREKRKKAPEPPELWLDCKLPPGV